MTEYKTEYLVYKKGVAPFYLENRNLQDIHEKIHFAKQLLSKIDAIEIKFWHEGSRYSVSK